VAETGIRVELEQQASQRMRMIHLRILVDFDLLDLVLIIPERAVVRHPRLPVACGPVISFNLLRLQ